MGTLINEVGKVVEKLMVNLGKVQSWVKLPMLCFFGYNF